MAPAPELFEWAKTLAAASRDARVFPLPPLQRPSQDGRRGRAAARAASRVALWHAYEALRRDINEMYTGRTTLKARRPDLRAALHPDQVLEPQREVVKTVFAFAKRLRSARRDFGPTGAAALQSLLKNEASQAYETQRPGSPYVPLIAADVAEPSDAARNVPMLEALPPELAAFYSKEENVLADGCKDPHVLQDVDRRYRRVVGTLGEWRKYLNRLDVQPLWKWLTEEDIKARCAVAVVPKSRTAAARDAAQAEFGFYEQTMPYQRVVEASDAARIGDIGVIGDEEEVARRLRRFRDAGMTDFLAAPFAVEGADWNTTAEALARIEL